MFIFLRAVHLEWHSSLGNTALLWSQQSVADIAAFAVLSALCPALVSFFGESLCVACCSASVGKIEVSFAIEAGIVLSCWCCSFAYV